MHGETKRKSSFSAPITKPIRKAGGQERLAQRRRDERQAIGWHRIDRGAQLSADRNHQRLFRLLLVDSDHVTAHLLAAHLHQIAAPLAGIPRRMRCVASARSANATEASIMPMVAATVPTRARSAPITIGSTLPIA